MKTHVKNPFLLPVLIAALGLIMAGRVTAQTLTTLHSFSEIPCQPCFGNPDGAWPFSGLVVSGNTLYGTTSSAGPSGYGTVFAVNTDGTEFTNLESFSGIIDGSNPYGGLVLSNNTVFGTTYYYGYSLYGTVYSVKTDGTGFSLLYSFTNNGDGAHPSFGSLVISGTTLYGATVGTGSATGTVFAVNVDGTGFRTVYTFTGGSDGGRPMGGLILSGQTLYGTTFYGGISNNGTVFAVNTDGTDFRAIHSFTNTDVANPRSTLLLSGNTLYGTSRGVDSPGVGAVFALKTDGTGFTVLHRFTGPDGAYPQAGLSRAGEILYGTTYSGGSSGLGTVFTLHTDGTGFLTMHRFDGIDGAKPNCELVLSENALYGTTTEGGFSNNGTVFSILLPPKLAIIPVGANIVLTWSTNVTGFTLQSTTNFGSSAVWSTNLPSPVIVNGQNTVTNLISGIQQFFRLSQ